MSELHLLESHMLSNYLFVVRVFFCLSDLNGVNLNILVSQPLQLHGEACLEFWYLVPAVSNGSELHALLKTSSHLEEVWTSPFLPEEESWRHVSVSLNITEPGTRVKMDMKFQVHQFRELTNSSVVQLVCLVCVFFLKVLFEVYEPVPLDRTTLKQIGVKRGSCGE